MTLLQVVDADMYVNCEQCNTTYRLDAGLVKESGTKVRCSACKHIFVVYPEKGLGSNLDQCFLERELAGVKP